MIAKGVICVEWKLRRLHGRKSEEEKEQARQDAINKLRDEEMKKMRKPIQPRKTAEKKNQVEQPSLFDL